MIQQPIVDPNSTLLGRRTQIAPNRNFHINPNGVDTTPNSDTFMKSNKKKKNWLIAAGIALAAVTTFLLFKGKKVDKNSIEYFKKSGGYFDKGYAVKNNQLFTGTLTHTSKNGDKFVRHYKDGLIQDVYKNGLISKTYFGGKIYEVYKNGSREKTFL